MSRLVALKVPRDAASHPYIVMSARRAGTLLKKGDVFCVLARAGTDKRVELAVPFTGRIEQTDARVNQMLTEPGAILARFRQVDEQAEDAGAATAQADGAARERAEADKAAAARAKADADRVAAEEAKEAEADRVAAEEAKKAEADRMAAEEARKAEAEKAAAERQAAEQKEQARLAAEEAKAERQAAAWRKSVAEEKRFNRMVLMFAFLVFAVGGGLGAWLYSVNGTEDRVTFSKPSQTAAERAAQARKDAEDDARLQAALDAPRRAREREQAEAAARARKAEERAAAAAAQDARQAAPMQEKRNGFHTVTYDSGGVYRGHFKDGKRHGQGTYDYASGNRYVGEWQNGQRHGQGVFTFTTGTVYEGTFEDGKAKGDGEARIRNGNRFKGNFMGAFGDARGIMYFASGAVRRGWVKDGKFYDRNPFPGKANLSRPRRIIRSGENRRRHSVDSQRGQTRYEAATLRPGHDAFFTSAPQYSRPGYARVERSDHFEAVELDTFHLLLLGPEDCWSSVNTWGVARYAGTPDALKRWRDRMERKRNVKVHDTEFRALEIARRDLRKLRSRYIDRSSDPQGADRRLQIAKHGNLPRDMCDGKFRYQEFDRFD